MRRKGRLLGHIAFAGALALLPPAIAQAANMVASVDNSSDAGLRPAIVQNENAPGIADVDNARIVTHAPVRLSPLAGDDSIAWDSAHSIRALPGSRPK